MNAIYSFVTGPLTWAVFIFFFVGIIGRFFYMLSLAREKDKMIFSYLSLKFSLRSILAWAIPFVPRNTRIHPAMTIAGFAFHICLFVAPLLLTAHVLMIKDALGLSWFTLPDQVVDIMTIIAMACLVFFGVRRVYDPVARYVTGPKEWIILIIVALPFVTGFLAYHQLFEYKLMIVLHVLCGQIMLLAVPTTWLAHMVLGPMVRAYMGSEFGGVRHVKDW